MNFVFDKFFARDKLVSTKEILHWWIKGTGVLNIFYLLYTAIFLFILVEVFQNGWIFFLFPIILTIWILINAISMSGFFIELLFRKVFNSKIDFNKISPKLKMSLFAISVLIILFFSLLILINES